MHESQQTQPLRGRAFRFSLGFAVLAAIAGLLLFTEHRAHVLGLLPLVLLLLLCPLLHVFMHGSGHGDGHQEESR